ncbi:hypothetical protein [Clostridium sp. AN503]|mgnify:CR=1 FL=1|uniref:InlB B-repeat-containing protein n=1 Tax=Clostridium sp. AN503 TaxID=3160598 RepID=UPI0034577114
MKGFKRKLSWLLILSMILGQASFSSLADSDDDDYDDTEIVLINDLFGGSSGRMGSARTGVAVPEFKDVKWNELASPSVTWEEDSESTAYYANGKAVTIIASGSNTYIVEDANGAFTEVNGSKTSYVYGGATASNAQIRSTDITLQGGRVNTIIGGNKYAGTIDQVKITINSGGAGVVYANASSGAGKTGIGDISGASSYAARQDRTVKHAEISVYGGSVSTLLAGNAGYSYTEDLKIQIAGGKIGATTADEDNRWGVFAGGANGEVKKSTVIVDGGDVSALSIGQRAYVQKAAYELNGGKIGEIYAGSWYPGGERFENYEKGTSRGNFHYGKAEKMDISIGQGVTYNGLYAGFHLLDSEREGALEWLEKGGYGFVTENYYGSSNKPAVTVSVGASPVEEPGVSDWLDGNDMIHNGFDASKEYSVYMTLNLPKVTAENAAIKVADGEVAKGTAGEMYILPGTEVSVMADEAEQDHKFSGWEFAGADLSDEFSGKEKEVIFTMPQGMSDIILKALYAEKGLVLDTETLNLDLYQNSGEMDQADIMIEESDYATPSVADYDNSVISIDEINEDGTVSGWRVTALKTGETTITFTAADSSRILAEVMVTVVDTTPELKVEGGRITAVDGNPVSGGITTGNYPEGADITLSPDTLPDKIFTGWKVTGSSGASVDGENILVMPDSSLTVTAQYRDKVFKLADGTKEEVNLNVDRAETNTDKTPDTYTFSIETDYGTESIKVYSANEKYAAVSINEDGSYTIKAVSAGITTILAALTKDNGNMTMIGITVNIADTAKKTEAGNGKADINADNAQIEQPKTPDGMDAEQAEELENEAEVKTQEAITSLVTNEAAKEGVSGFDRIGEQALLEAGIPAGSSVVIYPKQELKKIETVFEETKTIDPVTKEETVTYTPVVKKVVFDIKPYAASHTGAGTEKPLNNLRGSFRFRIPVPSAVSASARYAKLTHTSDKGGVVSNNQYLAIREENGHKYVDVTTTHFSIFELEFTASKPFDGYSGGGGGGGGSRTTTVTGKWILDATGWWYQYADKTYPANGWAYLTYTTNENRWYHFDANGYMQTGWFTDTNGHRYYLHAVSDGTMGHMYTGWHEIDGKWYYFTVAKTETNPVGSLLVNAVTPDGYQVGADGARVQ